MIYKGAREAATEIDVNCVGNDGWFAEEEAAEFISKRLAPLVEAAQLNLNCNHQSPGLCPGCIKVTQKALEDLV